MARFFGKVGYGSPGEFVNGVWSDSITERPFKGDVPTDIINFVQTDNVNDDTRQAKRVSILADAYALANVSQIKYVDIAGVLWKVTSVATERPRLILTLGGVWDGSQPTP